MTFLLLRARSITARVTLWAALVSASHTTDVDDARAQTPAADEDHLDPLALHSAGGWTVEDVIRRAQARAPMLRRALASLQTARAGERQAWLALWPRLELSARYTRLSDIDPPSLIDPVDPSLLEAARGLLPGVDDPEARLLLGGLLDASGSLSGLTFPVILDQFSLRAQLVVPATAVLLRVLPSLEAAGQMRRAAQLRVEAERAAVALRAREAYFEHVRARGALAVALATERALQARRAQLDAMVEAGLVPRVESTRLEAQLASTRLDVERARGAVELTARALRLLVGDEGRGPIPLGEPLERLPEPCELDEERIVRDALVARPEAQALRALLEGRAQQRRSTGAARWPEVVFAAAASLDNPSPRLFPQERRWTGNWELSAVLSWSPNDALDAEARLDADRASLEESRADLDALLEAIRLEVHAARSAERSARGSIEVARAGLAAAEEALRVRAERLRAGTETPSDVLQAETERAAARMALLDAHVQVQLARARLLHAVGGRLACR
ncbi:MAG: TolC family protein [Myxococcales bacterium]|nr:TolC family protein [Myxococcales bacterium]